MPDLIIAPLPKLPLFSIPPTALAERDNALCAAALIGKIENQDQNDVAVRAAMELKRIASQFEKQRKAAKEPLIEAGRQLDRLVETELAEISKEMGRISNLAKDFQLAEQRRIYEEQEAQRKELERIEQARQAEIQRIAREQAEAERIVREAREKAERMAAEATNKKAAAEAEAARIAAEKLAKETAGKAQAQYQAANENAQAATLAEAKPIVAQRTAGQSTKQDWDIIVTNPYELAKFHPDCVKIEPLLVPIKAALNNGITVKGIRAERKLNVNFRAAAGAIEI